MKSDQELLTEAANFLEITELEVLRIARYKWRSKIETWIEYKELERMYGKFMLEEEETLPIWTREYLRKLVQAYEDKDKKTLEELLTILKPINEPS